MTVKVLGPKFFNTLDTLTRRSLDSPALVFAADIGLALPFALCLADPPKALVLLPATDVPLNGRLLSSTSPFTFSEAFLGGSGTGSSRTLTMAAGLQNMPCAASQWKYRSPWTEPSFLPDASPSSTPIQAPGEK